MQERTPLTDRVNSEPAIINGMSASEAQYIAAVSLALSAAGGGALFMVTGMWALPFLSCIGGPLAALWYGSMYLQKIKRGRPDAFYVQAAHIWMAERGWIKSKFNRHNRFYEIGVRMPLRFDTSLEISAQPQKPTPSTS